jgi:uncharacterized protein (DUF362 family)
MFEKVRVPILGIVENMSTFTCPHCGKDTDVFRRGGGERMSRELGVPFLGSIPLDADVVINLPKIKVHGQMYLTLAVKNLFGCVRGRRKALLHQQIGGRPIEFARMLVDVCRVVQPALTLMDGIVALERTGPTGGDPRPLGLVLAGSDCTAMDRVICEIVGADCGQLLTLAAAREVGFGEGDLDRIQVLVNSKSAARPLSHIVPLPAGQPFVLPQRLSPLSFSPWRIVRGLARQAWALLRPTQEHR